MGDFAVTRHPGNLRQSIAAICPLTSSDAPASVAGGGLLCGEKLWPNLLILNVLEIVLALGSRGVVRNGLGRAILGAERFPRLFLQRGSALRSNSLRIASYSE